MPTDLDKLAQRVATEIDTFTDPGRQPGQLGTVLPPEWFEARLAEMRNALVPPYALTVCDHGPGPDDVRLRSVIVVADNADGVLVAYDPDPDGDFVLLWRRPDQVALSNLRDMTAVGSYLTI
jgi:hypothetical protein